MLHIQIYRARKRYRALVAAIAMEANASRPSPDRLERLRRQRDAARDRANAMERATADAAPA